MVALQSRLRQAGRRIQRSIFLFALHANSSDFALPLVGMLESCSSILLKSSSRAELVVRAVAKLHSRSLAATVATRVLPCCVTFT